MPEREAGVCDVAEVTIDRNRISSHLKATVTVISDTPFSAIEARATKKGSGFGRGVGICLLSDDESASEGVITLPSAVNSYTFDAECSEIMTDGEYRISVFVMNTNDTWSDCSALLTNSSEVIYGKDSKKLLIERDGSGTDEVYISAYSGADIDGFITEVLT